MRLWQWFTMKWKGFISIWIASDAAANPEVAYAGIIQQRLEQRVKFMRAVEGVHAEWRRVEGELEASKREFQATERQLKAAISANKAQAGALLLQKKRQLETKVGELTAQEERLRTETERLKKDIQRFNRDIAGLKEEARVNVARLRSARATKQVLDQIEGLSIRGDDQALDAMRDSVRREIAGVEIRQETRGDLVERELEDLAEAAEADASASEFAALRAEFERTQGVSAATTPESASADNGAKRV